MSLSVRQRSSLDGGEHLNKLVFRSRASAITYAHSCKSGRCPQMFTLGEVSPSDFRKDILVLLYQQQLSDKQEEYVLC
jgi:hypothetical protein